MMPFNMGMLPPPEQVLLALQQGTLSPQQLAMLTQGMAAGGMGGMAPHMVPQPGGMPPHMPGGTQPQQTSSQMGSMQPPLPGHHTGSGSGLHHQAANQQQPAQRQGSQGMVGASSGSEQGDDLLPPLPPQPPPGDLMSMSVDQQAAAAFAEALAAMPEVGGGASFVVAPIQLLVSVHGVVCEGASFGWYVVVGLRR